MESGTEGLFHIGCEAETEASLEVDYIYERIQELSDARKALLIDKLIETLTSDEIASVIDSLAIRLRNRQ